MGSAGRDGRTGCHLHTEAECPKVIRSKEDNREYVQDETGDYIERTAQWYVKVYDPDTGADNQCHDRHEIDSAQVEKWMSMIMSREPKGQTVHSRLQCTATFTS